MPILFWFYFYFPFLKALRSIYSSATFYRRHNAASQNESSKPRREPQISVLVWRYVARNFGSPTLVTDLNFASAVWSAFWWINGNRRADRQMVKSWTEKEAGKCRVFETENHARYKNWEVILNCFTSLVQNNQCLQQLSSIQSACAILYCHVWPVQLFHILPHYLTKGAIFGKKLFSIKCVFWFPLQRLSKMYLNLRRTRRDINLHRPSCKVPIIIVRL